MYKFSKYVHTGNRGDRMKKYRLRKPIIGMIYALTFISVFSGIYFIEKNLEPDNTFNESEFNYVSKININETPIPVVSSVPEIIRPYKSSDVILVKDYYDYKADKEKQKNALLYYEDTYLQSSGVSYSNGQVFDVVSILDGTVVKIKEDNILGKTVEIRHDNDTISIYQSLSEIYVNENDIVKQGDVLGKSGENNISKELGNHLYFELIINGQNVNPEEYYNKKVTEI